MNKRIKLNQVSDQKLHWINYFNTKKRKYNRLIILGFLRVQSIPHFLQFQKKVP